MMNTIVVSTTTLLLFSLPMDRVHLLPSISVPPMPPFELFLCRSLVTAADDDDDDVVDCDINLGVSSLVESSRVQ